MSEFHFSIACFIQKYYLSVWFINDLVSLSAKITFVKPLHLTMKNKLLLAAATLFITLAANSQQLWKEEAPASQSDYQNRNRGTLPDKVKFYTLDASILQSRMLLARSFDTAATTASIQFPLPDGSFITADVYESSIITPEMQAVIPGVKTYMLVDNISKSSLGRITISDNGITGLIFTDNGTVYINPVNSNSNRVHIIYYTKEVHYPVPVGCGVNDAMAQGERENGTSRVEAGDCHLRTYKLAVAVTGEYTVWAGSQANALTYITTTINSVDAIYERDATIRFTLVTNNSIIYTDSLTDPYPTLAFPNSGLLDNNNLFTNSALGGAAAYDVGIVFNYGWNGGLAQLSSVCGGNHGRAAAGLTFGTGANPTAGPQGPIFEGTVAHEIGHQFSATHTMIASNGGCSGNVTPATAYEPGGGSSLMAYAGTCTGNSYQSNSDLYFHTGNVAQIAAYATSGAGNSCPVNTTLVNVAPTVSVAAASYTIPVSTPFTLTCAASDANANSLTYTWEQMDAAAATTLPPASTNTTGPAFRSFPPTANQARYFPNLPSVLAASPQTYEVLPSVTRTMNFRVNVRDNAAGGSCNAQADIAVTTNSTAGPFTVTSQSGATSLTANGTNTFTITWNVASTNIAPVNCSNVDILFSADAGQNFNYTLLSNTPNDGTQTIIVPNIVTSSGRIMIKSVGNIFFNVNAGAISISSGCGAEGALLSPSSTVSGSPGNAILNLSSTPSFGTIISPAGTLQSSDPTSNLAVFSSVSGGCVTFGNLFQYDAYSFQVNVAGTYTFTKSAGTYITNLDTGSYTASSPCAGFIASNGTFNGASVAIGSSVSGTFVPGVFYTLAVGTFASGTPALPFSYTITVSGPGSIYSGYPNPGGSFSYKYVIVNNASNNIVAISNTPDLSNSGTYPVGTYTVYGFSYLTANFSAGTLSGYVGGAFATLTSDLFNTPSTRCGNLSKNNVSVNIINVLPVKLLPLTAVWEGQQVKLYWATATEEGSKNFVIERSGDGQTFIPLKTIPAAVNSTSRINYITYDPAPLSGRNFYRIKAVDLDEKYVYSNIALVKKIISGFEIKVYPNPITDLGTIEILASGNGSAALEIFGANGSSIHKEKLTWKKGINVETFDMQKLPAGIYYIKISSETNMITQKIIKI